MAQCPTVDIVFLNNQTEVDDFGANYPECTDLPGGLIISSEESSAISNLTALSSLTSIGSIFSVTNNELLTSLTGLDALQSIEGEVEISGNASLTNMEGLGALQIIGRRLLVSDNASLSSFEGLDSLTSIGGELTIAANANLISVDGLNSLSSLGGSLVITDHLSMTSLEGLSSLLTIQDFLQVTYNASLPTLSGLGNIDLSAIDNLFIQNNPNLSWCSVESICQLLETNGSIAEVGANAVGCNDWSEITDACSPLSVGNTSQRTIKVFPNPTSGIINLPDINVDLIEVYTAQRQLVLQLTLEGQEIDLSGLSPGLYHIELQADKVYSTRVIKM